MNNLNRSIEISDQAAYKIKSLIKKRKNKLRIYILGGGCSGFQYKFIFDEKINPNDLIIKKLGIILVIDSITYQYITGGKIEYIENLEGSKFIVSNPNAKTTCSCGASFSI